MFDLRPYLGLGHGPVLSVHVEGSLGDPQLIEDFHGLVHEGILSVCVSRPPG